MHRLADIRDGRVLGLTASVSIDGTTDNILDGWTGNISVADLNRDGLPDILMYRETNTPPGGGD